MMAEPKITKEEFEAGYAKRSEMTVEELHEMGQHAHPCDCGEFGCRGCAMLSDDPLKVAP